MYPITTSEAPAAIGPYSQAMVHNGLVFTSGQSPRSPASGQIVGEDIVSQTRQVMANLTAVLTAAGSAPERVVKTTCFLANMDDFAAFNEVYAQTFPNAPARSCVAVKTLPRGVLVEVECIGVVD